MDKAYLLVILSGILSGTIVFGGGVFSSLGFSAYEISLFPLIPTILLLPLVIFRKDCRPKARHLPMLILYGLVTAVIVLCQYIPVVMGVPVAIVVLLLYTQPVWTLIFTRLFLNEKITRLRLISAAIVLLGVVILVNPWSVDLGKSWAGILISLIGGIALSGWIILGSVASKDNSHIIATKFIETTSAAFFVLLSLPLLSLFVSDKTITALSFAHPAWLIVVIIAYGLFANLINHLVYFEGVKKVPTVDAGIILLLEPVVGSVLSAIFLSQPITFSLFLGGALILLANYLVIAKAAPAAAVRTGKSAKKQAGK